MLETIRANRHEGLGSSDAKRIMDGDWHRLYAEKVGLQEAEDLSKVFRVQLGIHTEKFHLDWLEQLHQVTIDRPANRFYDADWQIRFAHLDGWHVHADTFVEVKHTNSSATLRDKALYYAPQLHHAMFVTGRSHCYFSIIAGNDEPEWAIVSYNDEYAAKLDELERSFWWHVEQRVPPEIIPTGTLKDAQALAATTVVNGYRSYDMSASNEWAYAAGDYLGNFAAAKLFEEAKTTLKSLVPQDAADCTGHGITIKRDKRGALRFAL